MEYNDLSESKKRIMSIIRDPKFYFILLLVCLFPYTTCSRAETVKAPLNLRIARDNIGIGKRYTFDPKPNYKNCTDNRDIIQLTDGKFTKGYFWTQPSTVGWVRVNPVNIVIDLQSILPISGISYSTAAGVAGVRWPRAIFVFVSDNSITYRYVGDLIELDDSLAVPEYGNHSVHRFLTDKLRAKGRYVKLVIVPNGPFVFVDEIRIFKGAQAYLGGPAGSGEILDTEAFALKQMMRGAVARRLENDIEAIRQTLGDVTNQLDFEKQLDNLKGEISGLNDINTDGFSTAFPLNELHGKIFKVQAAIWRSKGYSPITLWQKNRWDMVHPTELQTGGAPFVDVKMMRNEYRSAAFNITNTSDDITTLHLTFKGLPGGITPPFIRVHCGIFTDTAGGVPVMAALTTLKKKVNGYSLKLYPGLTRQVWLTFNSKNLAPGHYNGEIDFGPKQPGVPVSVKVYPISFPEQPRLHLGGWDYTNEDRKFDVTPDNRDALIKHLKEHYVDTPWASSAVLDKGKYDRTGNMIKEPDTRNFERWIKRWPNSRKYFVFVNAKESFRGFKTGSYFFKEAVKNWIDFWVEKLERWNIRADQLGLLLVDEPYNNEQSKIIIQYAEIIKSAQPEVIIFEDVAWKEPWKAPAKLFDLSDILCINLSSMWVDADEKYLDFYKAQKKAGRTLWFYSCNGPGRLLDPYGYHRLQPWFAWQYGATGSCFWAFGDSNGASSWNEYLSKTIGPYTPVFLDKNSVTPGKHMEAVREGVADYEYLCMLRDRIDALELISKGGTELISAKDLIASAAERVLRDMDNRDKFKWAVEKNRKVADAVREEILEALMRLAKY